MSKIVPNKYSKKSDRVAVLLLVVRAVQQYSYTCIQIVISKKIIIINNK